MVEKENIHFQVLKEKKEKFQRICREQDTSMKVVLNECVDKFIKKHEVVKTEG